MELGAIATVTTGHIDKQSAKELDARFEDHHHHPDPSHWTNDLIWAGFPYGWLLSIGSERFDSTRPEYEAENVGVPKSILEITAFAKKRGVRWICFDRDAPEVEGVTLYDW